MIKTSLLFAVLTSAFVFAGCKKDEQKADNAPKTAELAADDTAAAEPATGEPAAEEKAAEPAPAGDMAREQVAEKAVAMFSQMAEVVKGAEGDCAKIATELTVVITESKPIMQAGKAFEEDPENKKWFEDNYGEKVKGIMTQMMSDMGECMTDPAVQGAFESMEQ
jgi:hypothetical protein